MTTAVMEPPTVLEFQLIPLANLVESRMNVRRHYSPAAMQELEASIRQVGVLTPLIARPMLLLTALGKHPEKAAQTSGQLYELAAGHRRYRAAQTIGLTSVPVRVMALDDEAFRNVLIIENLQRQDIHPLDEADGYQALMDADKAYTVEAIAAKVGKSASYVYQRLKLTHLIGDVREAWDADEITPAHAVRLARLTPEQQKKALPECWHPLYGHVEGGPKAEPAPLSKLEHWIERHVQIAPAAPETAYYFPEIAEQLAAEEEPATLLQLSESHMPGADLGTKTHGILGHGRWTRITGPKNRCANVEKGVVVHGGPMRILEVCATKGCPKHFPARKKVKTAARSTDQENSQERWKREADERKRKHEAWDGVRERALTVLANALKKAGPNGRVIEALQKTIYLRDADRALFDRLIGKVTAANIAVALLFGEIVCDASRDFVEFSRIVKPFELDLKAIEAEYRTAAAPPKAEKTPAAKAKTRKAR